MNLSRTFSKENIHTYKENNIFGKVNFFPQFSQRSVLKAEKT